MNVVLNRLKYTEKLIEDAFSNMYGAKPFVVKDVIDNRGRGLINPTPLEILLNDIISGFISCKKNLESRKVRIEKWDE